jgi:HEAT repeat protein
MADRSEGVQAEAVETLGELGGQSVGPALARIVRTHPSHRIREEGVQALAEVDPAVAGRLLEQIIDDRASSLEVQLRAVQALEELPRAMALPLLVRAAREHPSAEVREQAREVLEDVRGR